MVRFSGCLVAALVLSAVPTSAHCEMLVNYNFTDNDNVADFVAGDVAASGFLTGGGLTSISYAGTANARGWNPSNSVASAISNGDFWAFTITAQPGYTLDLSALTFDDKRGTAGPVSFQIDVNGTLVSPIGTATTSFATQNYDLSSFSDLTSATIRLFAWNASNNGNSAQWYVDNVTLTGSTAQMPLPSSLMLLGTGAFSLFGYRGLFRRRMTATFA